MDIFLDRDGTLITDTGYINSIDRVVVLNGVIEGLLLFKSHGFRLHLISNQSGIRRGMISGAQFDSVAAHISSIFLSHGIFFESFNYCFHLPSDSCECRKPKIGLLRDVSEKYSLQKSEIVMIGNTDADKEAATNFGIKFWMAGENEKNFRDIAEEVVKHFNGYS